MTRRRRIIVTGIVQGVGFRPAIARAAAGLRLAGWVANTRGGAEIEVQGPEDALGDFVRGFDGFLPANARIASSSSVEIEVADAGEAGFEIRSSLVEGPTRFSVPPDIATCPACLSEFADPADRRYRYPFITCGDCGPRYSYMVDLPYDRANTTMADFPMCPACRAEYEDPEDRRFHIEGFSCPACGPRLTGYDEGVAALRRGGVVAVKGIGGYHLACLADDAGAVAELRRRKDRPTKPLAVMFPSLSALEAAAALAPEERELLLSAEGPIVLLPKDSFKAAPPEGLAPDNPALGVFLPYAPLHRLLLGDLGRPLVMTSANMPGDPLVIDDGTARLGLAGMVDAFIAHDRRIHKRADDGVLMLQGPGITRIRSGRGSVPSPMRLARPAARSALAVGAELKSTVSVVRGSDLATSPHVGDLEREPAFETFRAAAEEMLAYYGVEPELVVADLHPDYESTRYAIEFAEARSIRLLRVQHHHAHLLSVLLDLGMLEEEGSGPFLGIILDGTGYGEDGAIWGGEILLGGARGFERAAHLAHLPLPGGEAAIREPWRILAGLGLPCRAPREDSVVEAVARIASNPRFSPRTSSCGRLFDAAAALLGFDRPVSFEGEAAIWLEALARRALKSLDTAEVARLEDIAFPAMDGPALLRALAGAKRRDSRGASSGRMEGRSAAALGALAFHRSLARNVATEAARIASAAGLDEAFLSGGVFQNRLFTRELVDALAENGLRARLGERVSPNDACISVGQAAYAVYAGDPI